MRPDVSRFPALSVLATACAALCGLPDTAAAQSASADTALPEVRVSGQRSRSFTSNSVQVGTFRDQDPLDVPMTNNAVTREVLDAQGARTLYEALRNTAGVTRSQLNGATYDNISIRGILVENRGNHRLNGSLPIINLVEVPLENKERVEVLKGASSLYYGFIPPSGIVNYVTKRPTAQALSSVTTSVNQHGGADLHMDVSRRFGPEGTMGLRVNAAAGKVETGVEKVKGDRSLASLAWDWKVSPKLNLKFDLEHYRKDVSEPPALTATTQVPPMPANDFNLGDEWQRYKGAATNMLLRADVALNDTWLLTLEAGRARTVRDRRYASFTLQNPATGAGTLQQNFVDDQSYVNQNLRAEVSGRVATGPLQHELTAGVTRNRRHDDALNYDRVNRSQNLYQPVALPELPLPAASGDNDTEIVDTGLYLSDRLILNDQWQVLAGVRHTDYRYDSTRRVFASAASSDTRYDTSATTPNVSLLYKATDALSVYASYLEGLEESAQPGERNANYGEFLRPAVSRQKELGVKARVGRGLLLQSAYFDIDRELTTTEASTMRLLLAGRSRSRGVELSAAGELSPQWSFIASAQWLDAEITESRVAGEQGKTPENTAKHTASLFAEYKLAAVPGWAVNAGVYHVGKRAINNTNTGYVGSYTTLSAGTRYTTQWQGVPVTWQANLDNATNRDYWSTAGNGLVGVGLPRTLRLAAKFDF
ncbi:TonB-dependent siderophore receptor [Caldimonas brevitalea]|uniref:TonB-dependent receptor n=1 Tax=Caldimonas brevitalea TaxID=413882 RepID=A0A0G3BQJ5_9BURK|nr:TonB-dependent siderophore receptor [Caldimonas brevitalea]AKJ29646.1 TonB-dependent receptor [Caldimonas brevitalea]